MKRVCVLVADRRELYRSVEEFLSIHNIPVFEVGIGCKFIEQFSQFSKDFDEVWNVGSVGSLSLPRYSVFEVGAVFCPGKESYALGGSPFTIRSVDNFIQNASVGLKHYTGVDMELAIICNLFERKHTIRSFKYVSDVMDGSMTSELWFKEIADIAFVVSESLIRILKKQIVLCQKTES